MGLPRLLNSYLLSKGEKDSTILRDLVHYYYTNSPDEAIEWIKSLATEHDRKLMARMLINDLTSKAPGTYFHKSRLKSLESLRPLAREFPASFDHWVKQSLMMYSVRGNTDGFVQIVGFEAEFLLGTLRNDWTLEIRYDFNYTQAINEFTRVNRTLSEDHRMTLPSDFHSQWEKSDAEGARAWRIENPDWNSPK